MPRQRTPVRFVNARFTVFSDRALRMEYRPSGRFPKTTPVTLAEKLPATKPAEVAKRGRTLTLKTESLTLTYTDDGKPFHAGNLRIEHPGLFAKTNVWRPGDTPDPLCEHVRSLDVWTHWDEFEREEHPGLFDRGGARAIDLPQVVRQPAKKWYGFPPDTDPDCKDCVFIAHGQELQAALADFVALFGPIPLVPRWTFGFWYSRWFEYTQQDILKIAKQYRRAGLPMDVMVIDTEWRQCGWDGYDWHKQRFPRPRALIKELKKMGLRVPLNDHPGYNRADVLPKEDSSIPQLEKALAEPPVQGQWACDWARREPVEAWRRLVLNKPFKDGMDFWWVDGWTTAPFYGVKGQFWANLHYYELAEVETKKRGLILSRWGGWGSHRYPVQFSGDTVSDWPTLKRQVSYTAAAGDAGAAYWSHDIGGFFNAKIEDELYIRWIQFGAFSPVFRTHSAFGTREPFAYSKQAQKVFKQVARLRYAMVPYWYQQASTAHETGLPLCRPMYLHFPQWKSAYRNLEQYFIGPDVLVAPIYRPGQSVERPLWVPPGTWIRPDKGEIHHGQSDKTIRAGLEELPVYYRLGAIVPHQEPAETTDARPLDPLHLDIYPEPEAENALALYEDDGESREHATGKFSRMAITCKRADKRTTVTLHPPKGTFRAQRKRRQAILNIWLAPEEDVAEIRLDGKALPKSAWQKSKRYAADVCTSRHVFCRISIDLAGKTVKVEMAYK